MKNPLTYQIIDKKPLNAENVRKLLKKIGLELAGHLEK